MGLANVDMQYVCALWATRREASRLTGIRWIRRLVLFGAGLALVVAAAALKIMYTFGAAVWADPMF